MTHSAKTGGERDVESPDNLCERCGHPKPRLIFDEARQLLLCGQCLEWMQSQEGWCLWRASKTV